jgi:hypothetical protein
MPSLYPYPNLLDNPNNLDVKGSSTQKFEPLAQHPDPQAYFKLLDSNFLAYGNTKLFNVIQYLFFIHLLMLIHFYLIEHYLLSFTLSNTFSSF